MDNKPNLPEPPATEEPPLQQTPNMANQPLPPSKPPIQEPTPPPQPIQEPPKKRKWIIALVIIVVLAVVLIVSGIIYWFTVMNTINHIDEQEETAQMMEEHRINNVDELVYAYETKRPLDCSYSVVLDGDAYDINEQANSGWLSHKFIAIGNDSATTILTIEGDAVYSWGYTHDGEEFALRMSWEKLIENISSEEAKQFNTEEAIVGAKDSIQSLSCLAIDSNADYSIPERDWLSVGE